MKCALSIAVLAVVALGSLATEPEPVLLADGSTPTVATVAAEPTPPLTVVPPTVGATAFPTAQQEAPVPEKTAVATVVVPTVVASPVATPAFETTPVPSAVPTSTPSSIPGGPNSSSSSGSVSIPWPSPDQLRQDARLRWGAGVPASVRRWAFLIVPAARKYHLDRNLIAAVMTMESNGDPLAESPAGAIGLMQILNGPWDPRTNVNIGARMLSDLYAQFGDWSLALAGYNAGPGAVEAAGGIPPYRETRDYVIVVEYLWDLFGHHHLSVARRLLYQHTLSDLARYKDQRKKVVKLAHIAHITNLRLQTCSGVSCPYSQSRDVTVALDPFWPVNNGPDPLQQVGPVLPSP